MDLPLKTHIRLDVSRGASWPSGTGTAAPAPAPGAPASSQDRQAPASPYSGLSTKPSQRFPGRASRVETFVSMASTLSEMLRHDGGGGGDAVQGFLVFLNPFHAALQRADLVMVAVQCYRDLFIGQSVPSFPVQIVPLA